MSISDAKLKLLSSVIQEGHNRVLLENSKIVEKAIEMAHESEARKSKNLAEEAGPQHVTAQCLLHVGASWY